MGFEVDDELCRDFLVEAGETLEHLGAYLVDLERHPDDQELLHKVFRGFHNIKGGAGFLGLNPLVEVCHCAEDVFNALRQGERRVDRPLMDVVFRALDVINGMVDRINEGEAPAPADPLLLGQLSGLVPPEQNEASERAAAADTALTSGTGDARDTGRSRRDETEDAGAVAQESGTIVVNAGPAADEPGDITDQEFEALLDALQEKRPPETPPGSPPSAHRSGAEISDEEFEGLLDELHGVGRHDGLPHRRPAEPATATPASAPVPPPAEAPPVPPRQSSDRISDEEFEVLLDELHGPGRHQGVPGKQRISAKAATPSSGEFPQVERRDSRQTDETSGPAVGPPGASERVGIPSAKPAEPAVKAETTVRIDTKRLDDIMNMVGELVLARNRLATLKNSQTDDELASAVGNLDVVTSDLQVAVMKSRMQPIKKVFGRFPRLVRDLARNLNKEVELELQGEDTDLDKNLVEVVADPLVHLIRNAVDHGIETPETREALGKPRAGTVALTAEQEGDHILLTIADDGAGMDAETLRGKAVEKGLMDAEQAARLDERECYNLIFMPGFSTMTNVSDVSGRGVGMDVVKTRIARLNGSVQIDTEKGKGTRFYIKLPLTLAIMPTLMVMQGTQIYAFPLLSIVEIIEYDPGGTRTVDGRLVILLRDKALPLFHLQNWLPGGAGHRPPAETGHVVIVGVGAQRVGFVVDRLLGQEEVVIKPLGVLLQGTPGLAAATITGSGRIALILDVPGLVQANIGRTWEVA